MTNETRRRVHRIYGYVLAGLSVLGGASLIFACLSIYFGGGDTPYSRESVWAAFLMIAVPFLLCVAAILGGVALFFFLPPTDAPKIDAKCNIEGARVVRDRLSARVDLALCEESVRAGILREIKWRKTRRIAAALISALAAVPALVYLLDTAHFPNLELNREVLAALTVSLPCAAVALAACAAAALLNAASLVRESGLLRAACAAGAEQKNGDADADMSEKDGGVSKISRPVAFFKRNGILLLRAGVFAMSVAFLLLGALNGGMNDVLEKAVRICTECIGLG